MSSDFERFTLRLPPQQRAALDDLVDDGRYPSRSEAVRAAIRRFLDDEPDVPAAHWQRGGR